MQFVDYIPIIVTVIGVFSFAALFTILYQSYANAQIDEIKSGKRDIEIIDDVIYERRDDVKKRRKKTNLIKNIVYYAILCIIVPIFVLSLVNKITNNVFMINNKAMMVVASNSMSVRHETNKYLFDNNLTNQFNQYDIIILEKVNDVSELNQYDVISFKNDKGINIIHRIKEIEYGSEITFLTRGDSNNGDDKYHPKYTDIVGKYTGIRIKGLGIFIMFLQSYAGIITIISLVYCLIMIDKNAEKIQKAENVRAKQLEQIVDYNEIGTDFDIKAKFQEVIYYKGYAYTFDDEGTIKKKEIDKEINNNLKTIEEIKETEGD